MVAERDAGRAAGFLSGSVLCILALEDGQPAGRTHRVSALERMKELRSCQSLRVQGPRPAFSLV